MCTALHMTAKDRYFGRNLDLDRSYGEEVCVMPRRYPLVFREMGPMLRHYAMIGMATVMGGIPLFYEAANEHGLGMAGLNFPGNAYYAPLSEEKDNIAPFEFIPWILGQCRTVDEAETLLSRMNLADIAFSTRVPPSPLHWMIADQARSIVVECMRDGMHIHENPVGALTNNPPFEHHLENLDRYRHLRNDNRDVERVDMGTYTAYCQGLGAVGLPGDVSSMSRFVRAAFGLTHSVCDGSEKAAVGQFFHLLTSVEMIRGVCRTDEGTWDITGYSACINLDKGLYYYTTYGNRRITCVDMHKTELDGEDVRRFPLISEESIQYQN